MRRYQKPIVEVIDFELEEVIMDDILDPSTGEDFVDPDLGWE